MQKLKYEKGQPYPLGAVKTDEGIRFSVVIPDNVQAKLLLYNKKNKTPLLEIAFDKSLMCGNIGSVHVIGASVDKHEYCYEIDNKIISDEYSVSLSGIKQFGMNYDFTDTRSGFLPEFDWGNSKKPDIPMEETIMYSLHVRGFTKHNSSNSKYKGTFAGIIDKIPYFKNLGINQLELMPVYEFADAIEVKQKFDEISDVNEIRYKCNYWGYSVKNRYFSVKSAYSYGYDASIEFKKMIKALHENNIEVVLQFYFDKDTDYQLIIDCLRFWLLEYRVDGFRILGETQYVFLLQNEPLFTDVKLYFQYLEKNNDRFNSLNAITNEQYKQVMRAFLKSDMGRSEEAAYLTRRNKSEINCVNYICCHDGFTMNDMVSYEKKHNELNEEDNLDGTDYNFSWNCGTEGKTRKKKILELREKQMKNAWFMLMFSRGIPAILAGDEMCNSQNGNNNAYCQDNPTGWVNWNVSKCFEKMPEYVKYLIEIRKRYTDVWNADSIKNCLNEDSFPVVSYHGEKAWNMEFRPSDRHFGVMYTSSSQNEQQIIYIAYNMNWMSQQFALPKLKKGKNWYVVVDTSQDEIPKKSVKVSSSKIKVQERSCVLLTVK